MKSQCHILLALLLLVGYIAAELSVPHETDNLSTVRNGQTERNVMRVKRSPLGKLPLLVGAALIGKKALLLGGAAVGAKALVGAGVLGAKALVGAGVVGAGLYKAKSFSGGYGGGYATYNHAPSSYVESTWD